MCFHFFIGKAFFKLLPFKNDIFIWMQQLKPLIVPPRHPELIK
ncbi:Hypothetical Protein SLY_0870 [Strawberry lethal yellows phytoplasma (CPA) str. NZSb11]|uniref:Uncharacterized protein n=1 Tax=Strawberry lethal yellows phytoplasma (CPA) str. NZSb11 TaxID=980422 RepID=R4RN49_PHYAS|nr:Hypothetical Protein SLY_0870 [Strawberry lethal yellows phytoplasma (CPA) str. NZSb11]